MRRIITSALVCATLATAALAQEVTPVDPAKGAAELRSALLRITPNVLMGESVRPTFLLPVVGNAAGANGTFFRSSVILSNFRSAPQRIAIQVLRQGTDSGADPVIYRNLPAYEAGGDLGLVEDDFLASLGKSGLASVIVTGVDANGNPDASALLDGYSRIYTVQPSTETCTNPGGQVSQSMAAVRTDLLTGTQFAAFAVGLRQDENFRTNVGIVNLSPNSHGWMVKVFGTRGTTSMTVSVPGNSMNQFALPAGNIGPMVISFTMIPDATSASARWNAYGTSVDNRTGDSWLRQASY